MFLEDLLLLARVLNGRFVAGVGGRVEGGARPGVRHSLIGRGLRGNVSAFEDASSVSLNA